MYELERLFRRQATENLRLLGVLSPSGWGNKIVSPEFELSSNWGFTIYDDAPVRLSIDDSSAGDVLDVGRPADEDGLVTVVTSHEGLIKCWVLSEALVDNTSIRGYATNTAHGVYRIPRQFTVAADVCSGGNALTIVIRSKVEIKDGTVKFKLRNSEMTLDTTISSPTRVVHDSKSNMLLLNHFPMAEATNIVILLEPGTVFDDTCVVKDTIRLDVPLKYHNTVMSAPLNIDRESYGRTQLGYSISMVELFN